MAYKIDSNIPAPTEKATEKIREGFHYEEIYSV